MGSLFIGCLGAITICRLMVSYNQQSNPTKRYPDESFQTRGFENPTPSVSYEHDDGFDSFFVDFRNGRDGWTGTLAGYGGLNRGPFKTIRRAVVKIRKFRKNNLKRRAKVFIRGGYHYVPLPIRIDHRDSGLSFLPYPGDEMPILSTGQNISGSSFTQVPNEPSVWVADFKGICSKHAFLGNKQRLIRARKPNIAKWTGKDMSGEGPYLYIKDLILPVPGECDREGNGGFQQKDCPEENRNGFKYKFGDIDPSWYPPSEGSTGEIVVFQAWVAERGLISNITEDAVYFNPPLKYPVGRHPDPSGWRYIVENIRSELDAEGEFFCDEANEKFYVMVPEGTFPDEDVYVARSSFAIRVIKDAKDIEITNLEFRHSHDREDEGFNPRPAALDFERSEGINVTNCVFANIGYSAIHVTMCKNVKIENNVFEDVGYLGVVAEYPKDVENGGDHDSDPYATRDISIVGNTMNGCGVVNMLQPSCILVKGIRNIVVARNDISRIPYAAIRVGWQSTFVLNHVQGDEKVFYIYENHLHNFGMKILNDFGGVYLAANPDCAANDRNLDNCHLHALVSRNVIHNSDRYDYGGLGVSSDSGASSLEYVDNWLYDLASSPINYNCGLNNKAVNNMIYHGNSDAVFDICAPKDTDSTDAQQTTTLVQNVVYVTEKSARMWRGNDLWNGDVPDVDKNLYFFKPFSQEDYDDFFPITTGRGSGQTFTAWQCDSKNDENSLVKEDPLFVDIETEDFRLKDASPAIKIGIHSVDLREVRDGA